MTREDEAGADREIVLTRVVDAPPELVWEVWTDPDHLVKWWGPQGFSTTTRTMQCAVGGVWRYVMHGPDGRDYENQLSYLEIEPPRRLRYRIGGEVDCEPVQFETVVTFVAEADGRTRVTMRSTFPNAQAKRHVVDHYNAIEGGKQHLARLDGYVARQRAAASGSAPLVISRVLRAPRELVFAAWTEQRYLEQWFGPAGCRLTVRRLELRPGGVMHYGMHFAGGGELWGRWVFREIVAPERLVFTVSFADAAGSVVRAPHSDTWPLLMLTKVLFVPHAGKGLGTVVTVESSALEANAAEQATFDAGHGSMRGGWGGTLQALETHLARHLHGSL